MRTPPGPVLRAIAAGLVGAIFAGAGPSAAEDAAWCGTGPDGARHALALHAWAAAATAAGARTDAPADRDADGVALLADQGDLLVSRNPFDLDPARGGSLTALVQADRAAVLWSAVPGGGQVNRNTFEIVLHASGEIDLVYGTMESREAVAGVTPGRTLELTRADLSAATPAGAAGALVERFSETEKLDLVSVLRRFYASHADAFEQVVVYTTRPLNPAPGTLAFELNIKNAVTGIGIEPVDAAAAWGSAGTLESVVYMDAVDPYLGSDGFEFLAHEVGHRWLARLRFREGSGALSSALLGRGAVHWSFFLDTQASVLEGNSIRDLGGGRFETATWTRPTISGPLVPTRPGRARRRA